MKNRDSKTDKRAEKSTEIAGKMPYHRADKLQKQRRHEVPENRIGEHFGK